MTRNAPILWHQERKKGGGAKFPGCRITKGAPNDCGGAEKSQQCHEYFPQHTFASERPQVRTWGLQT